MVPHLLPHLRLPGATCGRPPRRGDGEQSASFPGGSPRQRVVGGGGVAVATADPSAPAHRPLMPSDGGGGSASAPAPLFLARCWTQEEEAGGGARKDGSPRRLFVFIRQSGTGGMLTSTDRPPVPILSQTSTVSSHVPLGKPSTETHTHLYSGFRHPLHVLTKPSASLKKQNKKALSVPCTFRKLP